MSTLAYLTGFGNEFESEALSGALPHGQFSPQNAPFGLYTEKFSNSAFTAPRDSNRRTWFYRIRPSVLHGAFVPFEHRLIASAPLRNPSTSPNPLRWDPAQLDPTAHDFVEGLVTVAVNGDVANQFGMAAHLYAASKPMRDRCAVNADGEFLVVPYAGNINVRTECGCLHVVPGEIVVIPRGMKFAIDPDGAMMRGYVCENYGEHFRLPERGPVGSDGFANSRDFLAPVADFIDVESDYEIIQKYQGKLYRAPLGHNPFDVVAWVGNAVPYKYDLRRFNVMGSTSYDHPDPSIYTVLTAPSAAAGVANVDFVIFPPRWLVAEHTFRPPWFHRNVMSEFLGLICGQYDAKKTGFEPGGMSLHNALVAHGPDAEVFAAASASTLAPSKLEDTLAFMFESRYILNPTQWALESPALQRDYRDCWSSLARRFVPPAR